MIAAYPFQINAIMPSAVAAGQLTLQVAGAPGSATQSVNVTATAPGIFVIGTTAAGSPLGAILNQDGSINSANNPLPRGQYISIYGTGLGATVAQQNLQVATASVQALLDGTPLTPSYAGLTPGVPGLYQVNLQIPSGTPPGTSHTVAIQAAGQTSNIVALSLE